MGQRPLGLDVPKRAGLRRLSRFVNKPVVLVGALREQTGWWAAMKALGGVAAVVMAGLIGVAAIAGGGDVESDGVDAAPAADGATVGDIPGALFGVYIA